MGAPLSCLPRGRCMTNRVSPSVSRVVTSDLTSGVDLGVDLVLKVRSGRIGDGFARR